MVKKAIIVAGCALSLTLHGLAFADSTIALSEGQMDHVTAGGAASSVDSIAIAQNSGLLKTNTNGFATVLADESGGFEGTSTFIGVASGTATAIGSGNPDLATGVVANSSSTGSRVRDYSRGWTLATPSGSISGGFAVSVGQTGVFLLGQ